MRDSRTGRFTTNKYFIIRKCPQCFKEYKADPDKLKKGWNMFCSRICRVNAKSIVIVCPTCGKEYRPKRSRYLKGWNRVCSRKCRTKLKELVCRKCNKHFFLKLSAINKGKGKYCSRNCVNLSKRPPISLETRVKLSRALSGKNHPFFDKTFNDEHKKRIGLRSRGRIPWNKGKPMSEQTKKQLSKYFKQHPVNYWKGKKRDPVLIRKMIEARKDKPPPNLGKKFSFEYCMKLSQSHIGKQAGPNNKRWKGGITKLTTKIRTSHKNVWWIKSVMRRDNYRCLDCSDYGGLLEVHHIKPFNLIIQENHITTYEQAMECKELWDINNGMTLCKACHKGRTFNKK